MSADMYIIEAQEVNQYPERFTMYSKFDIIDEAVPTYQPTAADLAEYNEWLEKNESKWDGMEIYLDFIFGKSEIKSGKWPNVSRL